MRFWKHIAAAAAGAAVYKAVDYALRRTENRVTDRDVPAAPPVSDAKQYAVARASAAIDMNPSDETRNRAARVLDFALAVGGTAAYLSLRERLLEGVVDEEPDHAFASSFLIATGLFVAKDLLLKPAMGYETSHRGRRYVALLASRAARTATLRLVSPP